MKKTLFITGYPGFLASSLLHQLYDDHATDIDHIYLLVLSSEKKAAFTKIQQIAKEGNIPIEKYTIVTGDITKVNIGISPDILDTLTNKITHVFHLAGVYDLAVPYILAERINVHGTTMVNDWVQTLSNLERYAYFSTMVVSGDREGTIYENELSMNQSFRNNYEQTKYSAELLVDKLKEKVPTTIFRPAVVKGNSKTGYTSKFDGLYFMLNMYDKLTLSPFIPYIEVKGVSPVGNFVPSDYVLEASSYLSMTQIGEGKTYHLTDPNPYTMIELQGMLAYHFLGRYPKGVFPASVAKSMLQIRPIRRWLHAEAEAMDYFTITPSHDTTQVSKDLKGSEISCPDLKDTLPSMIEFYRKYKDDKQKQITIN